MDWTQKSRNAVLLVEHLLAETPESKQSNIYTLLWYQFLVPARQHLDEIAPDQPFPLPTDTRVQSARPTTNQIQCEQSNQNEDGHARESARQPVQISKVNSGSSESRTVCSVEEDVSKRATREAEQEGLTHVECLKRDDFEDSGGIAPNAHEKSTLTPVLDSSNGEEPQLAPQRHAISTHHVHDNDRLTGAAGAHDIAAVLYEWGREQENNEFLEEHIEKVCPQSILGHRCVGESQGARQYSEGKDLCQLQKFCLKLDCPGRCGRIHGMRSCMLKSHEDCGKDFGHSKARMEHQARGGRHESEMPLSYQEWKRSLPYDYGLKVNERERKRVQEGKRSDINQASV